ncbi:MAG: B12-binding domain-containing radical SAM protein [Oscillospiraceae bacterium]|nr:B12-binding domain-containing radical SAM protein [Oscillospiraceae bacterium]
MSRPIVLVNFYSPKSLGIRYLEGSLRAAGFEVAVVYFKGFHSARPQKPTETEMEALVNLLREKSPLFIGFSVMSSLYLEAVTMVSRAVREGAGNSPLVWGGVYATLFPERCLEYCGYVLRGEGEEAIVELAERLRGGADLSDMPNLAYTRDGETVVNPVRPLVTDLDSLPMAPLGTGEKYSIEGVLKAGDPSLTSVSYETSCSRGCPFVCAYCSTVSLKRIYRSQNRHYLRFRSVEHVIAELTAAKAAMKNLSFIHFWDEIFSDDKAWIEEFARRYRAEIGLPFDIWAHPGKTDAALIAALRDAGLYQVVMGIQSGSPSVRKTAFHRTETQEDILAAARVFADCKVPRVIYDLILRHPFESLAELKESYELCAALPGRFTLQMHGLNFLPGTDIVEEAVKRGLFTREQLEEMMYAPMEKQYASWWESDNADPDVNFWYRLTYLTQFPSLRGAAARLARDKENGKPSADGAAARRYALARKMARARHVWKKGWAVLKGKLALKG